MEAQEARQRRLYCFDSYNGGIYGLKASVSKRGENECYPALSPFKNIELLSVTLFNKEKERLRKRDRRRLQEPVAGKKSLQQSRRTAAPRVKRSVEVSSKNKPNLAKTAALGDSSDNRSDSDRDSENSARQGFSRQGKRQSASREKDVYLKSDTHCCRCGLFNSHCRMIPTIPEEELVEVRRMVKKKLPPSLTVNMPESSRARARSSSPERESSPARSPPKPSVKVQSKGLSKGASTRPQKGASPSPSPSKVSGLADAHALEEDVDVQVVISASMTGYHLAARTIQLFLIGSLYRWRKHRGRVLRSIWTRECAVSYFKNEIMKHVWAKVGHAYAAFRFTTSITDEPYLLCNTVAFLTENGKSCEI